MIENMTFEQAMKRLEEILKLLESGQAELASSIEVFEEGVKLANYCNKLLNEAEQKVKMLVSDGEDKTEEDFNINEQ